MQKRICAALALLAGCSLSGPSSFDEQAVERIDARQVHWQRTVEDAQALARQTGRPLLLALNMDGESASDRIWHENYKDPRFVALTRRCVCLGASVFRHNATDYDADGNRIPCPRFHGLTCGEHIALEPKLFEIWFQDDNRVAPRHVLIRPDGSKAFDLSLMFDLQDIDRAIQAEVEGIEPWCEEPPSDWVGLAKRRDAVGRTALERALARVEEPATLEAALAAIVEHGDTGALPALRLLACRAPDAPLPRLGDVAQALGVEGAFRVVLRDIAQRPGPLPSDTTPPAALVPIALMLARGDARDDPAIRAWLCAAQALQQERHQAWSFEAVFAAGAQVGREAGTQDLPLPRPAFVARDLQSAEALRQRLAELDRELAGDDDRPESLAAAGIASLDLGRVDVEAGGANAQLLFEDAKRLLDRALDAEPERFEWLLEASRTAYYRSDFEGERTFGERALRARGYDWPSPEGRWSELLRDADAIEALRWIGDGAARELLAMDLASHEEFDRASWTMRHALLALSLAAMSPTGRGRDFVTAASFAGSIGLLREEAALLAMGLRRFPGDGDVHGAMIGAMWRAGRFEAAAALAESAQQARPSAEASWWTGYVHIVTAEELRRRERTQAALAEYERAEQLFVECAKQNPDYRASVDSYRALCRLGRGQAMAQGASADREAAAGALVDAAGMAVDVRTLRDGLGYDAIDLVDKVLEWRACGPSPVGGGSLLTALARACEETPVGLAFWAAAVSDSALREALRADGRNPERRMADTVDAAGEPIRMEMGLPTELGDQYLEEAIAAGLASAEAEGAGDEERRLYAQALTIQAERELVRGRTEGVAEALQQAAAVLSVDLPAAAPDSLAELRAQAAPLRDLLGPARPRQRDGR